MPNQPSLLDASCRVAFTAYIHDLGKLGERANIKQTQEQIANNVHLYCPFNKKQGYHSHKHAAYTGICIDEVEKMLPHMIGEDMFPFQGWKSKNADDSMINAAASHHKPNTFLQWVIATADRIASGFEREEFEQYNKAEDKNHYRTLLISLFEQIHQSQEKNISELKYRYPLAPLTTESIFPQLRKNTEPETDKAAQEQYQKLWLYFKEQLDNIPKSHRKNWSLWLDHFDSLWMTVSQAIPAATAFNSKPDVSLYDHSKTTAALATALWRFHYENKDSPSEVAEALKERHKDWQQKKFLLIQGDFFGIQDFIFTTGGETNKQANKLLRGKSFYVSLLTELAALRILEKLQLPSTSQIINAAGKFLIVAANTKQTIEKIKELKQEFSQWFKQHTFNISGIGIAATAACANDFIGWDKKNNHSPFKNLMSQLFAQLEKEKYQRLQLVNQQPNDSILTQFLDSFDNNMGVCAIDGRTPAEVSLTDNVFISRLSADQLKIGTALANPNKQRILITKQQGLHDKLNIAIFGYYVSFTQNLDESGQFGTLAKSGELSRCWDISLPEIGKVLFFGAARRFINAYVPIFKHKDGFEKERYQNDELLADIKTNVIKTLNHIACEDRSCLKDINNWHGIKALHTLKGDVDDLGLLFENGLQNPSFAKMATLSRQINFFFSLWLPAYCAQYYPNTYTVFAGGDDFFLIGPWQSTAKLALNMRDKFNQFVAQNTNIHFSAGLLQTKASVPIKFLSEGAEHALEQAKQHQDNQQSKNAINIYGYSMKWAQFKQLIEISDTLADLRLEEALPLSTAYWYGLLNLSDMAAEVEIKPEAGLWRSYLTYRTQRNVIDKLVKKPNEDKTQYTQRKERAKEKLLILLTTNIEQHKSHFKVALQQLLYQFRI